MTQKLTAEDPLKMLLTWAGWMWVLPKNLQTSGTIQRTWPAPRANSRSPTKRLWIIALRRKAAGLGCSRLRLYLLGVSVVHTMLLQHQGPPAGPEAAQEEAPAGAVLTLAPPPLLQLLSTVIRASPIFSVDKNPTYWSHFV